MRWILVALLVLLGSLTRAETVVAVKTIRANTVLSAQDVTLKPGNQGYGIADLGEVIGMESRVVLYAGRPILPDHLTAPALVQRNEIVPLIFQNTSLSISTHGRALDRGAVGDTIRVMNISSRATLFGKVQLDGSVAVTGP